LLITKRSSRMNKYVTDTMALVLRLEKRKMGARAKATFEKAENDNAVIFVPAMVLAELMYLSERGRIETSLDMFSKYSEQFQNIQGEPLNEEIIKVASRIKDIPELHDRLIAATAGKNRCPLLTNDPIIRASKHVKTLW